MSKGPKKDLSTESDSSCEIIELAIDEIELLTRAFRVIESALNEGRGGEERDSVVDHEQQADPLVH